MSTRPRLVRDDFDNLISRIRMDLTAAQTKITELRSMVATLEIPTRDQPVNEAVLARLVENTRHEYTEQSLRDELASRGADPAMITRLLDAHTETTSPAREGAAA